MSNKSAKHAKEVKTTGSKKKKKETAPAPSAHSGGAAQPHFDKGATQR
jgi:hypothetical protein